MEYTLENLKKMIVLRWEDEIIEFKKRNKKRISKDAYLTCKEKIFMKEKLNKISGVNCLELIEKCLENKVIPDKSCVELEIEMILKYLMIDESWTRFNYKCKEVLDLLFSYFAPDEHELKYMGQCNREKYIRLYRKIKTHEQTIKTHEQHITKIKNTMNKLDRHS